MNTKTQPVASEPTQDSVRKERVRQSLLSRAQGHPRVLEIMADCADAIEAKLREKNAGQPVVKGN